MDIPTKSNNPLNRKDNIITDCLSYFQVQKIREVVKRNKNPKNSASMIDWFLVELSFNSGMRVFEMAKLHSRHVFTDTEFLPSLFVELGKGGKSRLIYLPRQFKETYIEFLNWKAKQGLSLNSYLFLNSRINDHYTTRALQKSFKRSAEQAKLPSHFSIHSARHTYALSLYLASGKNARLVQQLLGHSSLGMTEHYLNALTSEDHMDSAFENMYKSPHSKDIYCPRCNMSLAHIPINDLLDFQNFHGFSHKPTYPAG